MVLMLVVSAYGHRTRALALCGIYGVVLLGTVHLQDALLWLVCYEAATVLLLVTVLTWSTSASTRYHLVLSYMFGAFGMSSAGMAIWLVTGSGMRPWT